jgi:hypothetical protein
MALDIEYTFLLLLLTVGNMRYRIHTLTLKQTDKVNPEKNWL